MAGPYFYQLYSSKQSIATDLPGGMTTLYVSGYLAGPPYTRPTRPTCAAAMGHHAATRRLPAYCLLLAARRSPLAAASPTTPAHPPAATSDAAA